LGRLAEAERVLRPALEYATSPFNIAASQCLAGRVALERGDLELGESRLDRAWSLMQRSGGFQLIGPALAGRVQLALARGDLELARERAHEALTRVAGAYGELIYNAELYWHAARVEAELAERARVIGDVASVGECERVTVSALSDLDEAIASIPGEGAPPEGVAYQALAKAELARLRDERDTLPWQVAADQFRVVGLAGPAAYAELRSIEARALAGARATEIAEPLRAVHAIAVEIGSRPLLDEVLAMCRRAGVSLDTATDTPGAAAATRLGLTGRELEVLRLVADGRTNRQIGEELFITDKTASVHVSRILMKLGVANRVEAAATAHRLGLSRPIAPTET
jgi:ATP/maltotriose-dependent transcriptional regulator MalT